MSHRRSLAVGLLLLACVRASGAQQTFHDPRHGFSLRLPVDWHPMPDSVVREISRIATRATGSPVDYVGGYQVRQGASWGEFPYLLIQAAETPPPPSEDAFVRAFTGGRGKEGLDREAARLQGSMDVRQISLREPYWEADRHVLWLPSHTEVGNGVVLEGLSAMHLSRRGFVAIHYYDSEPGTLRDALAPVVRSLTFDEGADYQGRKARPTWWSGIAAAAVIGALVGMLGGALARRRKRPA